MAGYSERVYAPNDDITIEQFISFLYRYATFWGMDMTLEGDLFQYIDAEDVTPYAYDTTLWAVENGILGDSDMRNPTAPAMRGDVATSLMKFVEMM